MQVPVVNGGRDFLNGSEIRALHIFLFFAKRFHTFEVLHFTLTNEVQRFSTISNINAMNVIIRHFLMLAMAFPIAAAGQDIPVLPVLTGYGTYHGLSDPLKDLPVISEGEFQLMLIKGKMRSMR